MTAGAPLSVDIRPERADDAAAIRAVVESAFGGREETDLVDRLRAQRDIVLALAAETADGAVVGYVAFPRLSIETPKGAVPAVGLAPLAVVPGVWRRGVGSVLVRRGLALLTERGKALVFVLGDPAYYRRFGFDTAIAASFASPYARRHFMALRLAPTAPMGGPVRYPSAFADLG